MNKQQYQAIYREMRTSWNLARARDAAIAQDNIKAEKHILGLFRASQARLVEIFADINGYELKSLLIKTINPAPEFDLSRRLLNKQVGNDYGIDFANDDF